MLDIGGQSQSILRGRIVDAELWIPRGYCTMHQLKDKEVLTAPATARAGRHNDLQDRDLPRTISICRGNPRPRSYGRFRYLLLEVVDPRPTPR